MTKSTVRKAADPSASSSIRYVCIDNGASAVRVWLSESGETDVVASHASAEAPARRDASTSTIASAPNFIARSRIQKKTYVAQEISEDLTEYGSLQLKSPIERGSVVDWGTQKVIWDRILHSHLGATASRKADAVGGKGGTAAGKQRALGDRHVIITEPYFNFPDLQDACDTLFFEEYGASAIWRTTAAELAAFNRVQQQSGCSAEPLDRPECRLVLDCGHSFCHAVPIIKDRVIWKGVRRLDIGGKLLTNLLKETLSFRQWDMMEETWLVNSIKERCSFIAQRAGLRQRRGARIDLDSVLANSADGWTHAEMVELSKLTGRRNPMRQTYVLPDYANSTADDLEARYGRIIGGPSGRETFGTHLAPSQFVSFVADLNDDGGKAAGSRGRKAKEQGDGADNESDSGNAEEQQTLHLSDERFQLHERLFNPGSLGLEQCSLAELVRTAIAKAAPDGLEGMFYANILVMGGMARLPGLKERLEHELRPFAPDDVEVCVEIADQPGLAAAQGAANLCAQDPSSSEGRLLASRFVTAEEWRGKGQDLCRERFCSWNALNDADLTAVIDADEIVAPAASQQSRVASKGHKRQSANQMERTKDGGKKKPK